MSSQGGGVGSGNFPINITGNAAGLDAIVKAVAQYEAQLIRAAMASNNFAASAAKVGPALSGSGAGANQFASSMKGANQTMDQFTGSSNQAAGAAGNFQRTTVGLGQATGQFATSTNQANTSARGFQSTIVSLGQGTGQFANSTAQATNTTKGFQSTIVSLGQGTGTLTNNMNQANTATGGFRNTAIGLGTATGSLKTNLDGTATGFQNVGDQAEDASNKTTKGINSAGAAVTSMVGKVSGLFIGFTGLTMAMQEATGMQEMLADANTKVQKTQERMNEAIKQYGAGSHQATQATQAYEKALNGQAFAQRNANFAVGDTYYFLAMMSTQILSSVVPALVNWKETTEKIHSAKDFLLKVIHEMPAKIAAKVAATTADTAAETANAGATNLSGLAKIRATASAIALAAAHKVSAAGAAIHAAAHRGLTAAVLLSTNALRAMLATMMAHPVILAVVAAIAALVAILGAIKTDFMGARTALEGFGKSLGDTIPILKPFLDGIQGIGGALGLTGDTAEETETHFARMSLGFQNMGTLWHDTIALMQASNVALVQDIGFTVAGVSTAIDNMNTDFENQINASIDTWNKFVHALSEGDFEGAVDILAESLSAIPAILSRIGHRAGELLNEIGKGLKAIGTDLWKEMQKVNDALKGLFGEIGKRIVTWLGSIVADVTNWVNENVVEPILGFLDSIGIPATEIWTAIVGAANEMEAQVTAWVTENIVNPILGFIDSITTDPLSIWTAISGGATSLVNTVTAWVTSNIINPIKGFIDSISVAPGTIWTSIVSSATALVDTVTTWVYDNIVKPIIDFPTKITENIIPKVVAALGFDSSTTPGEIMAWVMNVAMKIMTLPTKIIGKAYEIVKTLLTGDYLKAITDWAGGVWTAIVNAVTGKKGENVDTEDPLMKQQEESYKNLEKLYGFKTPEETGQTAQTTSTQTSGGGPLLYQPGNASAAAQEIQTQRFLGIQTQDPWRDLKAKGVAPAEAPSLPPPKPQQQQGGFRNVAEGSYLQQNPETEVLQGSGTDINKMAEADAQAKKTAQSYGEAAAKLKEWSEADVQKSGTTDAHLKLGAQALLQTKDLSGIYDQNGQIIQDLGGHVENYGAQLEAKNTVEAAADEQNAKLRGTIVGTTLALAEGKAKAEELGVAVAEGTIQAKLAEQGYLEQTAAMQKMEIETIKNASALTTYASQLKSGHIQQLAFTLGEQDAQKALYDKEVALSRNAGKLTEYSKQVADGRAGQLAFTEGVQQMIQSILDATVNIDKTRGSLEAYNLALASGIPQSNAYGQALLDQQLKSAQLNEVVAGLIGTYQGLQQALNDTNTVALMNNQAFFEAAISATEWGNTLITAQSSQDGFMLGLLETAKALGVLPESFKGTTEGFQEFISLSLQAGEAFDSFIQGIESGADELIGTFADAILESNDAFNDAIDDYQDKWGIKFDKMVEDVFEAEAGVQAISNTTAELMKALAAMGSEMVNPQIFDSVRDSFVESMQETFDDIKDEIGPEAELLIAQLFEILNREPPTDQAGVIKWMTDVQMKLNELKAAGAITSENFNAQIKTMNEANFDVVKTSLEGLGMAITGIDDKTGMFKTSTGQLVNALGQVIDPVTGLATGIAGTGTAASTATPEVQQFYNTIANFGTIESVAITIFTQKLPEHAKTGAAAMAEAFSPLSTQIAPTFGEVENLAIVVFATNIPNHAAAGIPFIVAAFSLLPSNIAPYFGVLDSLAQTIFVVNIPAHATAMVPLVTNQFGAMINLATTQLLVLAQNADKTFKAIAAFSIVVPQAVAVNFGKAADDGIRLIQALQRGSQSAFQAMQRDALTTANHVGYIGNAASWAKGQIDSLASAIASLPRRTELEIVVTTRYRTVGSPSGVSGGQFGLHTTVDKPTLFLAGEGAGPETVQITPGTMGASAGAGSMVGKNNNVNVDVQSNSQSNVGGSGSIIQSSVNEQVNGVRVSPTATPGNTAGSGGSVSTAGGGITVQSGNMTISIGADGTVSIVQGNQVITTGPNGTSIIMNGNNSSGGGGNTSGGIRNVNPNPSDMVQNGNQVVSGGSIVGQNNNVNVQTDTNTNSNVGGSGTITQTQTNTQNPPGVNQQTQTNTGTSVNNTTSPGTTNTQSGPGFSQSSTVVSGSGRSVGSGHNISYQRNNSGETLMVDGQTYQAVSQGGTSSPSQTEFRRTRQTGSNAGPGVRTVVEQDMIINVNVDRYKLGRVIRKLMFDMDEGLYK